MREVTKQVKHEVDGKEMTFQIRKMNVIDGAYLAKFGTEKLLPVFNAMDRIGNADGGKAPAEQMLQLKTDQAIELIANTLHSLSREEMAELITMCLQTVDALLPAGWCAVMVNGYFGVPELEHDTKLGLILCYQVIDFNLGDFFGGKSLGSLLPNLSSSL